MAKSKGNDINTLTGEELARRLRELRHEALNLRLQKSLGQLEKSSRIRDVRRDTARVLTALNAKARA
jgi:large subunit ribosomal protein L29